MLESLTDRLTEDPTLNQPAPRVAEKEFKREVARNAARSSMSGKSDYKNLWMLKVDKGDQRKIGLLTYKSSHTDENFLIPHCSKVQAGLSCSEGKDPA